MRLTAGSIMVALLLAACSQSDAPSDEVEQVAETLVEEAAEELGDQPADEEPDPGPWAPQDECGDIEGASAFRDLLAAAVRARHTDAMVALAANDVKLDFGTGAGRQEFRARLNAEDGLLWQKLDELLTLGCAENGQGGITIPWYFAQEIPGDAFSTMIVTGENVPLYSAPETDSAVITTLSWDAVQTVQDDPRQPGFRKVRAADGEEGFVATARLRSEIDFRLIASSRNGTWSITSFLAGD